MPDIDPTAEAHGRGAWNTNGKDNGTARYAYVSWLTRDGSRPNDGPSYYAVNRGVAAIQNRLNRLGYSHPVLGACPTNGKFGPRTRHAVKWFQQRMGLTIDGQFGSITAAALWKPLVTAIALREDVPPAVLWGQALLESSGDPGAVSSTYKVINGPDYGLCQINLHYHPTVGINQAFHPATALNYSAENLHAAFLKYSSFAGGAELRLNCAIAAHNSPVRADEWFETGVPPTAQILDYVNKVKLRMDTF